MKIKAKAKVNLDLYVKPSDVSGLHPIQTTICLVEDFFDTIILKRINFKKDVIKSNVKSLEEKNFIYDVLQHLRKKKVITEFYKIIIKKRIPIGAGLGGGTSDAISVYLNLTKNRTTELDKEIAQIVGFDSYFFLSKFKTAKVSGYGEKVVEIAPQSIKKKDLILTSVVCETKKVYQAFDLVGYDKNEKNQLTNAAISLYPSLKNYTKLGVMSGSGSTFVKKTRSSSKSAITSRTD